MNIVNIKKAIAIMERAKARDSVDMRSWQMPSGDPVISLSNIGTTNIGAITTEEEFHACGNKACFGGHIAISPEFQADGGYVDIDGAAVIDDWYTVGAISYWLGISEDCADHFVYGDNRSNYGDNRSNIYPVPFHKVKAEHVIAALNQLLELGEEECLKLWTGDWKKEELR